MKLQPNTYVLSYLVARGWYPLPCFPLREALPHRSELWRVDSPATLQKHAAQAWVRRLMTNHCGLTYLYTPSIQNAAR